MRCSSLRTRYKAVMRDQDIFDQSFISSFPQTNVSHDCHHLQYLLNLITCRHRWTVQTLLQKITIRGQNHAQNHSLVLQGRLVHASMVPKLSHRLSWAKYQKGVRGSTENRTRVTGIRTLCDDQLHYGAVSIVDVFAETEAY